MSNDSQSLSKQLEQGIQKAIFEDIERHRKLGESIAISQNGKVVILAPEEIPSLTHKYLDDKRSPS